MMVVLIVLFSLVGAAMLAVQVAEPAVDRRRLRQVARTPGAVAASDERIVWGVGIR